MVAPGGAFLLALVAPFGPIKANTIGSITKRLLEKFGIATGVWGPHSTRGAGVGLYKTLGLSSETVCEIGKWKNFGAFQSEGSRGRGQSGPVGAGRGRLVRRSRV